MIILFVNVRDLFARHDCQRKISLWTVKGVKSEKDIRSKGSKTVNDEKGEEEEPRQSTRRRRSRGR